MRGPGIVGCVWLPSAATTCDLGRGGVTPPPLVSLTQGPGGQGTGSVEAWFPPPLGSHAALASMETREVYGGRQNHPEAREHSCRQNMESSYLRARCRFDPVSVCTYTDAGSNNGGC